MHILVEFETNGDVADVFASAEKRPSDAARDLMRSYIDNLRRSAEEMFKGPLNKNGEYLLRKYSSKTEWIVSHFSGVYWNYTDVAIDLRFSLAFEVLITTHYRHFRFLNSKCADYAALCTQNHRYAHLLNDGSELSEVGWAL